MTPTPANASLSTTPDYGVDAPSVMRNFFLLGGLCLLLFLVLPSRMHLGGVILSSSTFAWTAGFLLLEGALFLLYVKWGKFRQRDLMLSLVPWRGTEQVLDVGCGRGLLLAGAAHRLTTGHATGIDLWSNVDMGGNSSQATLHNLALEHLIDRCSVLSLPAQQMTFPDAHFDVILSNLCLHNIYDAPTRQAALLQIARVLAPGGVALISDYKRTREYQRILRSAGLIVTSRYGTLTAFPPLRIVIARRPA